MMEQVYNWKSCGASITISTNPIIAHYRPFGLVTRLGKTHIRNYHRHLKSDSGMGIADVLDFRVKQEEKRINRMFMESFD